jgi:hypothetical protein
METIQINQLLQGINTQLLNRPSPLTLEEKENLKEEIESQLLKILNLKINPVRVYNFFSDLLSNYLFNSEQDAGLLQPINEGDSQEIKDLKNKINKELTQFMDLADSSELTRSSAINLRDSTIIKIIEINGILESSFKLFTDAENNLWRILNISNFVFEPSYSFVIKRDDPPNIKKLKEYINLDLFILQKGLEDYQIDQVNRLNTVSLIYIYHKLLEKFKEFVLNSPEGVFVDVFLKKVIWKNSLPADFDNLYNSVKNTEETSILNELTTENLHFLNELGIELPVEYMPTIQSDDTSDLLSLYASRTNESVITNPQFEEDMSSDSESDLDVVSTESVEPFKKELCKESFITLENYTEKEYNQMLSFYLNSDKPSCITKEELLETIISDLERYIRDPNDPENIPQNIMCISTPPENPKTPSHYITGFTSKPTSKIFVKIPYKFNDSMSFYVTLGSFLNAITLPPQEWFAVPLFGGKRRRLSNLGGFYGESMNHGQIPGFKLYKLFKRNEIGVKATEDISDYPLLFYQSDSNLVSFDTQKENLSLVKMVYHTINFFLNLS